MAEVFHVVEDRPPPEPMWTAVPADPYDAPVWSAAARADADCVVTENLTDGPPPDERGLRVHAGIV